MKKILSLIAVLSLATACIYPYQPDLEDAPEGVLVVDGNLVIGEQSVIRIGFMSSLWPKTTTPSSPIFYDHDYASVIPRVWAENDGGEVYEGTPGTGGNQWLYSSSSYYSPNTPYVIHTENAPKDRSYRVCVQVGDLLYSSDWVKPLAPPIIKKITFKASKPNDGGIVTVSVTLDGGSESTGYVLLSFDETWRFHADYYPNYEYDPRTNTVSSRTSSWDRYWCWKTNNPGTQLPVDYTAMAGSGLKEYPVQTFSRFDNRNHQRYSIQVKARTIDKETYKYLRHLEESTESGDNLFTPNPGEIAGNLRCETDPTQMVLGYVTVAINASLRAYNNSQYLLSRANSPYDLYYPLQNGEDGGWLAFYQMGFLPLIENTLPDPDPNYGPYGWGGAPCYDCIAAGGTQEKPDFWEDK